MIEKGKFNVYDYIVFSIMLAASASIGIFYAYRGRKKRMTAAEYLLGGRQMSIIPTAISSVATVFSANGLMGFPVEVYTYGTQLTLMILATPLFIVSAAFLYLPVFYDLRITSVFEYLEKRFSKEVRIIASTIYILGSLVFMIVVVYAPSLALSHVTGMDLWTCIVSVAGVATFYTFLGGLKAVIWTDVFQASVMFISVLAILIKGFQDEGGIQEVWKANKKGERIEFLNMSLDPRIRYTFWGVTIAKYTTFLALFATNPLLVQRYLSVPSLGHARKVMYVNTPPLCLILTISCLFGIVAYSKYKDCDPLVSMQIKKPDELMPFMVMEILGEYHGFPGLFVAGLLSAALSTVSSMQNTLSTLVLEDFIKGYLAPDISDVWSTRICRLLVIVFGCVGVAGVFLAEFMGSGIFQITATIYGTVPTPILGLFTLGMFFPWVNTKGALSGYLAGVAFVCWIGFGTYVENPYIPKLPISVEGCLGGNFTIPTLPPPTVNDNVFKLYLVSFVWYGPLSIAIILAVGLAVSFATGANSIASIDPILLSPAYHKVAKWLHLSKKKEYIQEIDDSCQTLLENKYQIVGYENECRDYIGLGSIVTEKSQLA